MSSTAPSKADIWWYDLLLPFLRAHHKKPCSQNQAARYQHAHVYQVDLATHHPLSAYHFFLFLPHSVVISSLWPRFLMIWEWFLMFLFSYHRKNHCERNRIHDGCLCGTEFTRMSLYSTEITRYRLWFLEYKLIWVNSVPHRRPLLLPIYSSPWHTGPSPCPPWLPHISPDAAWN